MDGLMRTGMFALALGLLTLRFLPALPPIWLLLLLPVPGLMLLPFRTYPLAFFLFGFSWACAGAHWALNDHLALSLDGQTRWLEGRVVGLPQNADGVVRFELEGGQSRRTPLPKLMRLAWYGGPPGPRGGRRARAGQRKLPGGMLKPPAFYYHACVL